MTIVKHELRQSRTSFCIWTAAIGFLLVICVFLYPEMKSEMDSISDMFASMGAFTAAFGMDQQNTHYYRKADGSFHSDSSNESDDLRSFRRRYCCNW